MSRLRLLLLLVPLLVLGSPSDCVPRPVPLLVLLPLLLLCWCG